MRISDWSSDVCSSDLPRPAHRLDKTLQHRRTARHGGPAAIHVTPEAARDGALAKLREGDMIRLDGEAGVLEALVDADEWASREAAPNRAPSAHDVGRNLFRSQEHKSELQSLMRTTYAVFCLTKNTYTTHPPPHHTVPC